MTTGPNLDFARFRLQSGNWATPVEVGDFKLPNPDEVHARMEAFLRDGDRETTADLRRELETAIDAIYGTPYATTAADILGPYAEAVVVADGSRPVFFIQQDILQPLGQPTGEFVDLLQNNAQAFETAALAVGRVETDDQAPPAYTDKAFVGTAFLVADDLAMTNRHVLEEMVIETDSDLGPFSLNATYWLNFGAQHGSTGSRRFRIEDALIGGEQVIGDGGDIAKLDLAFLRIGPPEIAGMPRPTPLRLSASRLLRNEKVALIGYPGKPQIYYGPDDPPGAMEVEEVLIRHFDSRFGSKRCASGEIDAVAGFQGDTAGWTIKHDASTLGGNSGSPVLTLRNGVAWVSALHYGGLSRVANYGHAMEKLAVQLEKYGVALA